jgi:glycine dehydrogenase subunit 1
MDFVSNKQVQIKEMLESMGLQSIEQLFSAIPQNMRIPPPAIDDGISEWEGIKLMEAIASENTYPSYDNYIGAGAYEHHVPVLAGAICSKSEFLTSYTPYQAEASQGMLQAIFEFQSAICALTGLEVANASLYDAATACAEAVLMALRLQKDKYTLVIAASVHPHYRAVIEQYLASHDCRIKVVPVLEDGQIERKLYREALDSNTAAVLLQYPNFLGVIEDVRALAQEAKTAGALTILSANPLAFGLFGSAAEIGADIAVGDCQPLGIPLQFGGPYAGYMACKKEFVRQMPGRIVGETVDRSGNRGFVLTLQTREQHIRREKATSNICTNQALAALASLVSMLWYGKEGIPKLALTNYQRAAYLKQKLGSIQGITVFGNTTNFNEFIVKFPQPLEKVFKIFREHKIEPGIDLSRFYPERKGSILVAVTETKNLEQLKHYVEAAKRCV